MALSGARLRLELTGRIKVHGWDPPLSQVSRGKGMFSVECREASPGVGDGQERGPGLLNVSLCIAETVLNITA